MISATAPGKAVLAGEYAVLEGAPAISAAVNCRARVSLSENAGTQHRLETPGYLQGSWGFRVVDNGQIDWQEPLPDASVFSLVEAVIGSNVAPDWPALTFVSDTQAFHDRRTGDKFGLGSSAAVAVALTAVVRAYAGLDDDEGHSASAAHERFQGGRGSGVDVATSQRGGLILFRRSGDGVRRMGWPSGLHCRFLWSGRAAATADKLARLDENPRRKDSGDSMRRLAAQAESVAGAWISGDAGRVLESYPAYIEALHRLSRDHDLGIFDAGHAELAQFADKRDMIYKPCGAGGGDIGIVLAGCEHDVENFCNDTLPAGFRPLDVALDEAGLELAE